MKQDEKQVLALCLSAGQWYPKDVRIQTFDIEFPVENKAPKSYRVLKISHFIGRYNKMEVEVSVVPWNMPNKEFVIPYADNMTVDIAFNGDQPISITLTDNKGNANTFNL